MTPHHRIPAPAFTADNAHLHYEGGRWVEATFRLVDRWIAWRAKRARRRTGRISRTDTAVQPLARELAGA